MTWIFRHRSKIIRSGNKTLSKMMHPNAVDHDARRDGVVGVGDGIRELQAPAAVRPGWPEIAGQHLDEVAWDQRSFVPRIAPNENRRVMRPGHVLQHHGSFRSRRVRHLPARHGGWCFAAWTPR